jgi:hypothetical protein
MPAYRFYRLDRANHVGEPPKDIKLSDDTAAIAHAKTMLDGQAIEVWRGQLIVAHLSPKD